jgi:hypothetical protein
LEYGDFFQNFFEFAKKKKRILTLGKKLQTPSQEKKKKKHNIKLEMKSRNHPPKKEKTSLSFQTPLSNVSVVLVKGNNA